MAALQRHQVLSQLETMYAGAANGRGHTVLVTGAIACGKTRLLHEFGQLMTRRGAVVLMANASRAERRASLGIVEQLLMGSSRTAPLLAHLPGRWSLQDSPGSDVLPSALSASEAAVVRGVASALLNLAGARPVVLAIDDLQFADTASLQVLLYVQRRIAASRMLVVASEWAHPRDVQPLFHAELARHPHFRRLQLGLLTPTAVAQVVAQQLGAAADPTASMWHRASGGNPYLLHALIDDARQTGEAAGASRATSWHRVGVGAGSLVAPQTTGGATMTAFGRALVSCLHRWEPRLLRVGQGLALLGEARFAALVGQLMEMDPCGVSQAFEILSMSGIVHRQQFRHSGSAAAILDDMPARMRGHLHMRAGELLSRAGHQVPYVAAHVLASGRAAAPWARRALREAAASAVTFPQLSFATRCLELAIASCDDEQERAESCAALTRLRRRHADQAVKTRRLANTGCTATADISRVDLSGSVATVAAMTSTVSHSTLTHVRIAAPAPLPGMGIDHVRMLSKAEQRVAVLAARGYSNKDISRELVITVSTVEQHLTRVYRKLRVRRRELPAHLRELGVVSSSTATGSGRHGYPGGE
jgi:DNA-binding NarL/FixJ family response regulator